ncbi:MAG: SDR family NAD(P)-dependent oxidoreductase [Solirubrobacteraceae bacterium]
MGEQRIAIVSGASGGLGGAIAERLAADGYRVVLGFGTDRRAEALAASLPGASAVRLPMHDLAEVARIGAELAREYPKVHALVCCAGRLDRTALGDITPDELLGSYTVNCAAPVMLARALEPSLRADGGAIVNVSSIIGLVAGRNRIAYAAAKAALIAATRGLALELAPEVRANAIVPGLFDTSMNATLHMNADLERETLSRIPLKRLGLPSEFAAAVAWLVGNDASYVTGTAFEVDGGVLMRSALPAGD